MSTEPTESTKLFTKYGTVLGSDSISLMFCSVGLNANFGGMANISLGVFRAASITQNTGRKKRIATNHRMP